jgi:hypothetical protein
MRGMNCGAARLLIVGDPRTHYAEVAEHIGHCLGAALRTIGIERESVPFRVVYARNCDFRGHKVATS